MKKLFFYAAILLLFTGCGAQDSHVKEFVSQLLTALNNGDNAAIAKMYPGAADVNAFASGFNLDSVQIENDNMTGGYKVLLGNGNWFSVTGDDKESLKIVDSHGLFAYPKEQMTFAQETGWITANMNDQEMRKAFADTTFYDYLYDKTVEQLKKNVVAKVNYDKSDIQCATEVQSTIVAQVTNNGSRAISGEDYNLSMWSDMYDPKTVKGKDVSPKETVYLSARFPAEGMMRQIYYAALKWNISGQSKREVVTKYYEIQGGEYTDFVKTK